MIKTNKHGYSRLTFNEKANFIALYIGILLAGLMLILNTWQTSEARQERIKAQEAKGATMQLAVETADMAALMATFAGWGINSVPNFEDRNQFYSMTLSNSVDLIRLAGKDPADFASIRQMQGLVNYLRGSPGIINRPTSAGLEHVSGMIQKH